MTTITKRQVKTYGPRPITGYGPGATITAKVRYDDECGNGHNTFAITASIQAPRPKEHRGYWGSGVAGGCLHEEIAQSFPELAPFIKWHLVSSDGPMHYIANTLYWSGKEGFCDGRHGSPPNLDFARSSAVWPDATDEELTSPDLEEKLKARLPKLMEDFQKAVESLGFTF